MEPRLELEFECLFERFCLPRVRGGKSGSKKRYAGWTRGELVIVGLESVRRDWPAIARRLQQGMLTRLFRDEEVLPFVRSVVTGVVAGEFDAELVYIHAADGHLRPICGFVRCLTPRIMKQPGTEMSVRPAH